LRVGASFGASQGQRRYTEGTLAFGATSGRDGADDAKALRRPARKAALPLRW
jgi:hypothetical protein